MLNIQLARKYGTAIFEIANEDNKLEEYGRELADVSQALFAQAELKDFLTNPQIQPEDKKQVLLRLLKDQVSPMMMNFLLLLVDKLRFGVGCGNDDQLRTHQDQSIIGGVVVKIGDTRIDGSVIGRLQALKAELMASN